MADELAQLTIRLVVGGNAILEVGRAHVVVATMIAQEGDHTIVTIELPSARRWDRCVSPDFRLSYDEVCAAIVAAGHKVEISDDAVLSSTTARG